MGSRGKVEGNEREYVLKLYQLEDRDRRYTSTIKPTLRDAAAIIKKPPAKRKANPIFILSFMLDSSIIGIGIVMRYKSVATLRLRFVPRIAGERAGWQNTVLRPLSTRSYCPIKDGFGRGDETVSTYVRGSD